MATVLAHDPHFRRPTAAGADLIRLRDARRDQRLAERRQRAEKALDYAQLVLLDALKSDFIACLSRRAHADAYGNSSGDMDSAEMAAVNSGASAIQAFVAAGGGLHAMGESGTGAWGWLTTLIPGIVATDVGAGGIGTDITLTVDGAAAFPGLTNAQLANADPWHGYFSGNLGTLDVLGTALQTGNVRNVIISGGTETVIAAVPLPAGVLLLGLGAVLLLGARRRQEAGAGRATPTGFRRVRRRRPVSDSPAVALFPRRRGQDREQRRHERAQLLRRRGVDAATQLLHGRPRCGSGDLARGRVDRHVPDRRPR